MKAFRSALNRISEYFPQYSILRGHVTTHSVSLLIENDGHYIEFECECYGDSVVYKYGSVADAKG